MAYLFDDSSAEMLTYTSGTIPTTYPVSFSAWHRPDDATLAVDSLLSLGDPDNGTLDWCGLRSYTSAKHGGVFHQTYGGAQNAYAPTVNTPITANNWWHHAGTVTRSGSSTTVTAVLDGDIANKGTDSGTTTAWASNNEIWLAGLDFTSTGPIGTISGHLAEVGMWTAELTDAEISALAAGFSPLLVRPASLVFYAPLWNNTIDLLDPGRSLTINGTPAAAPSIHPPMIYPQDARLTVPAAAAVGVTIPRYSINALQYGFSGHPIASLSGGLAA